MRNVASGELLLEPSGLHQGQGSNPTGSGSANVPPSSAPLHRWQCLRKSSTGSKAPLYTVPVAFSEARFQVKKVLVFGAMEGIRNDKYLARS